LKTGLVKQYDKSKNQLLKENMENDESGSKKIYSNGRKDEDTLEERLRRLLHGIK